MKRVVLTCVVVPLLALAGCSSGEDPERGGEGSEDWPSSSSSPSAAAPSGSATPSDDNQDKPDDSAATETSDPNLGKVEPKERETKAPVEVKKPADFGTGVTAEIASTKGVTMTNVLPGEIAGPAIAVTIKFVNGGDTPADLTNSIVSVNYDGQEASSFSADPAKSPPKTLKGGESGEGVYVFGVPEDKRGNVTIRVSYSPDAPQVTFTGPVG